MMMNCPRSDSKLGQKDSGPISFSAWASVRWLPRSLSGVSSLLGGSTGTNSAKTAATVASSTGGSSRGHVLGHASSACMLGARVQGYCVCSLVEALLWCCGCFLRVRAPNQLVMSVLCGCELYELSLSERVT